jgi:uncharacterized membrane protein YdbT with pleckstrin-like domain
MRYLLVFVLFSFLLIGKANAFLPSESRSEISVESEKIKDNSVKNHQKEKESKKEIRKSKKEFKKAFRKAIFQQWKNNKQNKQEKNVQKQIKDTEKPSTISKVAFISGISFFGLILIGVFLSLGGIIGTIAVLAGILGLVTGIIGLATYNKEEHHKQKTIIYSAVGITAGILLIASFVLLLLILSAL